MQEPKNVFMYAETLNTGDKFVAIGDAIRAGANGHALFVSGVDHERGKEFVRISWLEDSGDLPARHEERIKQILERGKVTASFMMVDAAIENLIDDITSQSRS